MKKTCTPLVMSLHPQWVRKMLKGKKNMELRRVFPFRSYSGLCATFEEAKQFVKPIYFVKTGTTRGGFVPMVRVYAEILTFGTAICGKFFTTPGSLSMENSSTSTGTRETCSTDPVSRGLKPSNTRETEVRSISSSSRTSAKSIFPSQNLV